MPRRHSRLPRWDVYPIPPCTVQKRGLGELSYRSRHGARGRSPALSHVFYRGETMHPHPRDLVDTTRRGFARFRSRGPTRTREPGDPTRISTAFSTCGDERLDPIDKRPDLRSEGDAPQIHPARSNSEARRLDHQHAVQVHKAGRVISLGKRRTDEPRIDVEPRAGDPERARASR